MIQSDKIKEALERLEIWIIYTGRNEAKAKLLFNPLTVERLPVVSTPLVNLQHMKPLVVSWSTIQFSFTNIWTSSLKLFQNHSCRLLFPNTVVLSIKGWDWLATSPDWHRLSTNVSWDRLRLPLRPCSRIRGRENGRMFQTGTSAFTWTHNAGLHLLRPHPESRLVPIHGASESSLPALEDDGVLRTRAASTVLGRSMGTKHFVTVLQLLQLLPVSPEASSESRRQRKT